MPTISAKLDGVGAAFPPWILAGEQSGLLTRIAMTESVTFCGADEKLTAFLELESAIPPCEGLGWQKRSWLRMASKPARRI